MSDARGDVLNQALPYIQKFQNQTFVIKYGGSAMKSPALVEGVIRNVLLLQLVGISVVLVHGGGPEIDSWLIKLNLEKRVHEGLRVTDDETMDVVEMALSGRANKAIVAEIQRSGGKAIGLSGRDGDLLMANRVSNELGRVGEIYKVNPEPIHAALQYGFIPVVCSVASSATHQAMNVNADTAASAIAARLGASKLILMTDTNGLLSDQSQPSSTIAEIDRESLNQLLERGTITGGMIPKIQAACEGVEAGIPAVHLINGSSPNALLLEIFTDSGIGTMIRA